MLLVQGSLVSLTQSSSGESLSGDNFPTEAPARHARDFLQGGQSAVA